jgi:peroxiredoxin
MPEAQTPAPASRWRLLAPAIPIALFLAYQAVLFAARQCSDARIQGAVSEPLPQFRLRDRAAVEWTAASLRGRRAVLHFFRSRCEACEAEAPGFRQLERELDAAAVQVLHVMTDEVLGFPAEETAATLARKGFRCPVLMADAAFVDAFHSVTFAQVTPVTYLVDANGAIRHALRGRQDAATLTQLLDGMR